MESKHTTSTDANPWSSAVVCVTADTPTCQETKYTAGNHLVAASPIPPSEHQQFSPQCAELGKTRTIDFEGSQPDNNGSQHSAQGV